VFGFGRVEKLRKLATKFGCNLFIFWNFLNIESVFVGGECVRLGRCGIDVDRGVLVRAVVVSVEVGGISGREMTAAVEK